MAEKKVEWLLVGGGDIAGKRVAPALTQTANSKLVGVCDIVRENAEKLASAHNAEEVFTDIDDALSRTGANAVYLATPVFLHADHTIKALASGRHVLVEKPLGVNADDAMTAAKAANDSGLKAGCAYFRRCSPRYRHAAGMLQDNVFGKIVLVRMTYFSWFNPSPDDPKYWRVVKEKSGGGPLSDMGTHMFDVFIGLLGMPSTVYARTRNLVQPYEVEDSSVILMELPGGADVTASFHWNSKTWSHEFEIIGTDAKVKWHPYDAGPVIETRGRDIRELDLPNPENVHQPLVDDFVQAVIDNRAPVAPLDEAAKTNVLLDAVLESAASKKEVTVRQ